MANPQILQALGQAIQLLTVVAQGLAAEAQQQGPPQAPPQAPMGPGAGAPPQGPPQFTPGAGIDRGRMMG